MSTVPVRHPEIFPDSDCEFQPVINQLRVRLQQALRGKDHVVEMVLACLLARGHLLFEDLPGLGKTTLAKALAFAVGGNFARVQCTPDLLPGDITGFNMFNQKTRDFEFQPGPVFADVLLVDEINRATPRTQSALFEAMAERQVTVDGQCHKLTGSFFVIATQNPVEHHGTYPLPEAQLDRFAMKLRIGYPDRKHEVDMLLAGIGGDELDASPPTRVINPDQLDRLCRHVSTVEVCESVCAYIVDLANETRTHAHVPLGLSPRGLLIWQRIAQAHAHLHGRDFVTPDDVQQVAPQVLEVRLGVKADRFAGLLAEIQSRVNIPIL